MIIKKYEAVGLIQFSTFVNIDGKRVNLEFTPGVHYYNKSASITIKDKAIQDALEATNMFKSGRLRVIAQTEKIEPPKEVKIIKESEREQMEEQTTNDDLSFDNLKALQVYLVKNHKVSFVEVRSRENALSMAEKLGLNVTINN